jgi:hypothetical protein
MSAITVELLNFVSPIINHPPSISKIFKRVQVIVALSVFFICQQSLLLKIPYDY